LSHRLFQSLLPYREQIRRYYRAQPEWLGDVGSKNYKATDNGVYSVEFRLRWADYLGLAEKKLKLLRRKDSSRIKDRQNTGK
jgi:hypothetical protein